MKFNIGDLFIYNSDSHNEEFKDVRFHETIASAFGIIIGFNEQLEPLIYWSDSGDTLPFHSASYDYDEYVINDYLTVVPRKKQS